MVKPIFEAEDLTPWLEQSTHIILGPGLGHSDWAEAILEKTLKSRKPMVVDADALNLLARDPRTLHHAILTPHPGEAARLLNNSPDDVQANRQTAIRDLYAQYHGVIVLKGHHSLIYDGGKTIYECDQGNPGMATAGMGDVLSGVIAGLLPQCTNLLHAACLGVCVHAAAGDLAAKAGERGLIASDLFPYIRQILG
jgi:NAD(P)H-hydrate epimerase